jgi:hypothetical protein
MVTGGRLHKRIGDGDPNRTEVRAQANHARGKEMQPGADLVSSKQQDGKESCFQKKCKNPFRGERAPENIADEPGITGLVGAELEFHDESGRNAERKGKGENVGPEFGHLVVNRIFGPEPCRFDDNEHHPEADADGG